MCPVCSFHSQPSFNSFFDGSFPLPPSAHEILGNTELIFPEEEDEKTFPILRQSCYQLKLMIMIMIRILCYPQRPCLVIKIKYHKRTFSNPGVHQKKYLILSNVCQMFLSASFRFFFFLITLSNHFFDQSSRTEKSHWEKVLMIISSILMGTKSWRLVPLLIIAFPSHFFRLNTSRKKEYEDHYRKTPSILFCVCVWVRK